MKEKFPELYNVAKQWKEEGYEVFHNLVTSPCYDIAIIEEQAVKYTMSDIKEEHPHMKVVEYKAETRHCYDCVKTYVIVKCKKKKGHEKSNA